MTMLLFLNDIGTSEVVFILIIVLLLFGSKGLPTIAKNLGRGMREIKVASDEIKRDIQQSAMDMKRDMNISDIDLNGIRKPLDAIKNPIKEISKSIMEDKTSVTKTILSESIETKIVESETKSTE